MNHNHRVDFRVSSEFYNKLEFYWRSLVFVDYKGVKRHFLSRQEFLSYVFQTLVSTGSEGWQMFSVQKLKPFLI